MKDLGAEARTHQSNLMRTTIHLPDDVYRALKARAGLNGITFRQLVQRLIEQGLHSPADQAVLGKRHGPPPVIIPPRGVPIPAVPRAELARLEELVLTNGHC
jgi:hypothetical protein